jgi:hypothetical protein
MRYSEAADQRANQFVDIVHTHTMWIGLCDPYTYLDIQKCMGIIYRHEIGIHELSMYIVYRIMERVSIGIRKHA